MRTLGIIFLAVVVTRSQPALLASDEVAWKPESEQSAVQFLKKCREAMGDLRRFEIELLQSEVDTAFGTDERWRARIYFEQPANFIFERSTIDPRWMKTSRQTKGGELFRVKCGKPDTWLMVGGQLTFLDHERRTFESSKLEPNDWLFGQICYHLPQQVIPPWFDPAVDWKVLQSQLRVESVQSTPSELSVRLEPRAEGRTWRYGDDDRLFLCQTITVDRKTLQPSKWWRADPQGIREHLFIYKQFDLNPPQRELKVDLTGYKDESRIPPPASKRQTKSAFNMQALELGVRILSCLLF